MQGIVHFISHQTPPTRPPDLHDLQTYTTSRPTRPPDLHDLQTYTPSSPRASRPPRPSAPYASSPPYLHAYPTSTPRLPPSTLPTPQRLLLSNHTGTHATPDPL